MVGLGPPQRVSNIVTKLPLQVALCQHRFRFSGREEVKRAICIVRPGSVASSTSTLFANRGTMQ
jgi:hypothetical protein